MILSKLTLKVLQLLLATYFLSACATYEPYYSDSGDFDDAEAYSGQLADTLHTFLLIGDTGDPLLHEPDPVLSTLKIHAHEHSEQTSVLFTGDNIYDNGMPADSLHKDRKPAEDKISVALRTVKGLSSSSYFIPGNHDWRYGQEGLIAQENFIEQFSGSNARLVPHAGCPGPFYTVIKDQWLLIAIDSEWLLKQGELAETDISSCRFQTQDEVMGKVENLVNLYPGKSLMVLTHHPLYSNGPHGGRFTLKDHIFPLTNLKSWFYLPMPVLGSVYPVYRKIGNTVQDISNPKYQQYRADLLDATSNANTRIFVSGHEHSLAFFDKGDHLSLISGSGSKVSPLKKGGEAEFAYSAKGFAKLIAFRDGTYAVEFWVPSNHDEYGKLVFSKHIDSEASGNTSAISRHHHQQEMTDRGRTSSIAPGPQYMAGSLKKILWGSHYRDVWNTPIEVQPFPLSDYRVLDIGGGQQSVSIVVEDSSGQRSILRSIQKDPSEALPEVLRETFANDIIQDQISASHPYGALIVAELADAAGIHQTNPEIGFIPANSGLPTPGENNEAGSLIMAEEFVSVPWFENETGRQAVRMLGTNSVWLQLRESSQNRVDEEQFLRSRLFDMLIGDWDRHDGQWFWAELETESGFIFEPVPIDRDNAFFKSDGIFPTIASRKWALRKFQHFDYDIRDIKGMNFNAQHLDRWFLNESDREDWMRIAKDLKNSITDQDIKQAVGAQPAPAFELTGKEITDKLKTRRDLITTFAERYYSVLAREVRIFGSEESDTFEIFRFENGNVRVRQFPSHTQNAIKPEPVYERMFHPDVTDEIRLYGFDSDDKFVLSGTAHDGILLRLIPGDGTDIFDDRIDGPPGKKRTYIYDSYGGLQAISGRPTRIAFSKNRKVHQFNREAFQYNYTGPLVSGGFNPDDGVFLGGGVRYVRNGFRKTPYASMHEISVKHALQTSAFSFHITNRFTEVIGSLGLNVDLDILAPDYKANYFGLGNETEQESGERSFYRFRMDQIHLKTSLEKRISSITTFRIGPEYAFYSPSETPGRFISSEAANLTNKDFEGHHFGIMASSFQINSTDNDVLPYYGFRLHTHVAAHAGLNRKSESFVRLKTEGTLYYTAESVFTTFGFRIGAESNIGDFNFFQANALGGHSLLGEHGRLRGYLRDRFAGRTAFFHNFDMRTRLFSFQSYMFPAAVGVLGFFDNGRVWLNSESSNRWHQGYGGGIWISPFRRAVLTATYSISSEDSIFSINAGFSF